MKLLSLLILALFSTTVSSSFQGIEKIAATIPKNVPRILITGACHETALIPTTLFTIVPTADSTITGKRSLQNLGQVSTFMMLNKNWPLFVFDPSMVNGTGSEGGVTTHYPMRKLEELYVPRDNTVRVTESFTNMKSLSASESACMQAELTSMIKSLLSVSVNKISKTVLKSNKDAASLTLSTSAELVLEGTITGSTTVSTSTNEKK